MKNIKCIIINETDHTNHAKKMQIEEVWSCQN